MVCILMLFPLRHILDPIERLLCVNRSAHLIEGRNLGVAFFFRNNDPLRQSIPCQSNLGLTRNR